MSYWRSQFGGPTGVPYFHRVHTGELDCPLPPGLLPPGLRVLLLNNGYNQPLQPGSLPSTLTFLQLGWRFNQPIAPGVLPASLLHLSLRSCDSQPLVQGVVARIAGEAESGELPHSRWRWGCCLHG